MDIESKKFLGQPKNFVSIFNALLFDGQHVLRPEYLKDENSELVMNVSSKHVPMHTRFPTILTVVLYVGESKWNVAKRLIELEIIHPGLKICSMSLN